MITLLLWEELLRESQIPTIDRFMGRFHILLSSGLNEKELAHFKRTLKEFIEIATQKQKEFKK